MIPAYLLLTLYSRAAVDAVSVITRRIRETGLGHVPEYGWRVEPRELLVECAADVVDQLSREIRERDIVGSRVSSDELVRGVHAIRQLTADEAKRFLAQSRAEHNAVSFGERLLVEGRPIPPGTYRVIKRVVVDEAGAHYVDEPGGVPIAGFWSNTLTRIEPVDDEQPVESAPAKILPDYLPDAVARRRSVAELVDWVGEDPGRARAALGVEYGGPDAPREDVVTLLMRTVERAGECVAVWNASAGHPCTAAAGPAMPHRCVATSNPDEHRRSISDHRCACGSSISAAEVPFELAERVGLTYESGRPGELPGTLVDVRAFNPSDAEQHPVGYLLVVGEGLPTPVRHELWKGDEFVWLKRDLARRNEVLARAVDYGVAAGAELRLALFDQYGHRVCHGVTVAAAGVGLRGGRATVRGVVVGK